MNFFYKIKRRIRKVLMSHEEYMNWEENESFQKNVIVPYYNKNKAISRTKSLKRQMVFMANGLLRHGGLADRFRGIISTYLYAKENGYDFRIYWNSPFSLSDYLQPNLIDWRLQDEEISYDMPYSHPIHIGSYYKRLHTVIEKERELQRIWMDKAIAEHPQAQQYHVYSNAHFGESQYAQLFSELFVPAKRIKEKLHEYEEACGRNFIAASFRFMQLLGDFEDSCGGEVLNEETKELYISEALEQITKIHNKHDGITVLVTSDSSIFVKRAQSLPFVYVIPGTISHVDTNTNNDRTFDKEFLDLLLLSKAKKIYRLHKAPMYYSGFPLTAGMITGVEVETIEY